MADNHTATATAKTDKQKNHALSLAFWLNFIFSIIELVGGVLTNSTAIITDALHDFTDSMAIGMAVYLEKISDKPANDNFTFGFKRFSLLSALAMSSFLLIGSVLMIATAVQSFAEPKVVHSQGMLALAVLGIFVNGLAFIKIKNGGDGHAHGHLHSHVHNHTHNHTHTHSHQHNHNHDHNDDHEPNNSQEQQPNQNSKAIMLHLLEDLLGWIAVLVGALVIYFTNWFWVDGVLTVLIALFVGYNAYKNLKETLKILLMATPSHIDIAQLKSDIETIEQVKQITQLRVWSLDGVDNVASLQLEVGEDDATTTLTSATSTLVTKPTTSLITEVKQIFTDYGIDDVTVEVEQR